MCIACARFPHVHYLSACGSEDTIDELKKIVDSYDLQKTSSDMKHTSWFFDRRVFYDVIESRNDKLMYLYQYARFFTAFLSNLCIKSGCKHGRIKYFPTYHPIIQKWCCRNESPAETWYECNTKFCKKCALKMTTGSSYTSYV